MQLVHQTQTNRQGCMSACLAMLTGRPIDEVTAEFHNMYWANETTPELWLTANGVKFGYEKREPHSMVGQIQSDTVYLLYVPSLNAFNEGHAILVDTRNSTGPSDVKIFDPAMGWSEESDIKTDVYEQFGDGDFDLRHWRIDLIIDFPQETH